MKAGTKLGKPGWSQRLKGRPYQEHGLTTATKALERGLQLDGRTRLGRAMQQAREDLVEDLGGLDGISPRQRGVVDVAVRLKVLADSATAWCLTRKTLVNGRKRQLYPIVGELSALLRAYSATLKDLGLDRVPRPVKSLAQLLAEASARQDALGRTIAGSDGSPAVPIDGPSVGPPRPIESSAGEPLAKGEEG